MARPRDFDEDVALNQAMTVFWRQGYEGTSLSDLTDAMGINRPSLYAAFGNKEELFRRALERYVKSPSSRVAAALALPTARETVAELLRAYADAPSVPGRPLGCLLLTGGLGGGAEAAPIHAELRRRRGGQIAALRQRFEAAQRSGELAAEVSAVDLARYYWAVLQGMVVQAADGASRAELRRVAELAMAAWPAGNGNARARARRS
jgi:AcrR family transcriptional regulator